MQQDLARVSAQLLDARADVERLSALNKDLAGQVEEGEEHAFGTHIHTHTDKIEWDKV